MIKKITKALYAGIKILQKEYERKRRKTVNLLQILIAYFHKMNL